MPKIVNYLIGLKNNLKKLPIKKYNNGKKVFKAYFTSLS